MVTTSAGDNSKKRYLGSVGLTLQIGIGLLSIYWVIRWSGISIDQLLQRSAQLAPLSLFMGVLFFALTTLFSALRYSLFLNTRASYRYLTGLYLFQNALLTITPWRIGELSFPALLYKDYRVSLINSGSILLLIRSIDLLLYIGILTLSGYRIAISAAWLWVFISACITGVLILILVNNKYKHLSIIERVKSEWVALEPYRHARILISAIGLSIAVLVTVTMQTWFILRAVSFDMHLQDVLSFNAITLLASVLPVHPPGGWGTIDSLQSIALTSMGYETKSAVAAILIAHAIYTVMIVGGGIVGWLLRKNSL